MLLTARNLNIVHVEGCATIWFIKQPKKHLEKDQYFICINISHNSRVKGANCTQFEDNKLYLLVHSHFTVTLLHLLTCPTTQVNLTNYSFAKLCPHTNSINHG